MFRCLFFIFIAFSAHAFTEEFLSSDSKDPIEILSDQLKFTRSKDTAQFSGKVHAKHGDTELYADFLEVYYTPKNEKTTENSTTQKIKKIIFYGNVKIATPKETATSKNGNYDPQSGLFTLDEDVKLVQGKNMLSGSKLVYNKTTGESKLTSNKQKRVKAILLPKEKSD